MNNLNLTMESNVSPCKVGIRALRKNGMTVADLISELKKLNEKSEVVYYDMKGNTHNIINAIQDGQKVAIF